MTALLLLIGQRYSVLPQQLPWLWGCMEYSIYFLIAGIILAQTLARYLERGSTHEVSIADHMPDQMVGVACDPALRALGMGDNPKTDIEALLCTIWKCLECY